MPATTVVRCSDGHLYAAKWIWLVGVKSLRLGPGRRFARCPVDGRWRMVTSVDTTVLTDSELAEARRHHAGLQ